MSVRDPNTREDIPGDFRPLRVENDARERDGVVWVGGTEPEGFDPERDTRIPVGTTTLTFMAGAQEASQIRPWFDSPTAENPAIQLTPPGEYRVQLIGPDGSIIFSSIFREGDEFTLTKQLGKPDRFRCKLG